MADMAAASVTLEKVPELNLVSTPQILRVAQARHVLCWFWSPGLALQLRWASESRSSCCSAGITRPWQRPLPTGVLAFLQSTVSLYTSQAGLKLRTFLHPTHPLNLTVYKRGCHLHTQSTHSGFLMCRWLGHLLCIQCEHTEVRRA